MDFSFQRYFKRGVIFIFINVYKEKQRSDSASL